VPERVENRQQAPQSGRNDPDKTVRGRDKVTARSPGEIAAGVSALL